VSGCLNTLHGLSRGSLRRSSSTTLPRAGSLSTTSPTPRVRVPRHVVRLITWLVVDYFTYATRPVASVHRAACRVTHRRLLCLAQARRRLLRLHRVSGCLGMSLGSSYRSSSTTSSTPCVRLLRHVARLVVDYFDYAARLGASAHRAARHAARRRLLHLRHASGCLGTSRGSSRGSLSTTSTTPRIQVPRHVARHVTRLVAPLVVDYFIYAVRLVASARRAARRAARRRLLRLAQARRRLLRLHHASGCLGMSRSSSCVSSRRSSLTTSPTLHARCRLLRLLRASG
jgi:predicted DNA-binding transcriptional regulator AlpA